MKPDVVVAVGGGSVIDMAKLINVYAAEGVSGNVTVGVPLIAIPTTAGTGSEATQFARFTSKSRNTQSRTRRYCPMWQSSTRR